MILLKKRSENEYEIKSIISFSMALYQSIMKSTARQYSENIDWERSIQIEVGNINSLDFKLTDIQKETLIDNGRKAAKVFFEG